MSKSFWSAALCSLLLFSASGCSVVHAIHEAQMRRVAIEMRSRLRVGQSMPEVLTAAEEAVAKQRPWTPAYMADFTCGERYWWLVRWRASDHSTQFHLAGDATPPGGTRLQSGSH